MDKQVDQAVEAVEAFCAPGFMSKPDTIDFLEDVVARLENLIEALRDQLKDEEDKG